MIDTTGLTKPEVLKALYDNSKPQGLGFLHFTPGEISVKDCAHRLESTDYFDYMNGRVMKIDLSKENEFEEYLYDRDNGIDAAQCAIDNARKAKGV